MVFSRAPAAVALGIADRVWSLGDLLDAALATAPSTPYKKARVSRGHRFLDPINADRRLGSK
jgi:hypothetical protein